MGAVGDPGADRTRTLFTASNLTRAFCGAMVLPVAVDSCMPRSRLQVPATAEPEKPLRIRGTMFVVLAFIAATLWASCSSQDGASVTFVTPSVTNGAPPAPPSMSAATPAEERTQPAATAKVAQAAATTAAPALHDNTQPPQSGRWIDVDVTQYVVKLMDGQAVVRRIGPVAVGAQIGTGAYLSTGTGLFHVYSKTQALTYDAPFDTYISDWVGFDPRLDNGFHSFLKDKDGHIVDASTGRLSNGCIRTAQPEAIFAFAEMGMPVYVHK